MPRPSPPIVGSSIIGSALAGVLVISLLPAQAPANAVVPAVAGISAATDMSEAGATAAGTSDAADSELQNQIDPGPLPQYSKPPLPTTRASIKGARSQCQYGSWASLHADAEDAQNIMRGQARVTQFGTFKLTKNPNWRWKSTLDSSGNGQMHSLHWMLPLLRYGVKTGNQAMIKRFYVLIKDWIKDNPPKKPRIGSAYGQIQTGFRLLTLSCALAGPAPNRKLIKKAIKTQGQYVSKHWINVNNVSFLQAGGLYAAGCSLKKAAWKKRGLELMRRSSAKMIAADGSVREGSMIYARNTYLWTQQSIARVRACGNKPKPEMLRSDLIPNFLGDGARPDRRYEALGDGYSPVIDYEDGPANSSLRYAASGGTQGFAPNKYKIYEAGFIFGHSGDSDSRPFDKQTYYSIRTGPGQASEYHAHSDAGAITIAANGRHQLFDTGQYKDVNDAAARFIRTRAAHNNISMNGVSYTAPRPVVTAANSTADGDFTGIYDPAYSGGSLQRSVWYDRVGDYFVVMDDVQMPIMGSFFATWNLHRNRGVQINDQAVHSTGSGSNISIFNVGEPVMFDSATGSKAPWRGWNSAKYGELVPSPTVRSNANGPVRRLVTVLVPRPGGAGFDYASATGTVAFDVANIQTTINGTTYAIAMTTSGVTRVPVPTPTPSPTPEPSSSESELP